MRDFLPTGLGCLLPTPFLTTHNNRAVESSFVPQRLPWLIGDSALLVYLITLNHWISSSSVGTIERTVGCCDSRKWEGH